MHLYGGYVREFENKSGKEIVGMFEKAINGSESLRTIFDDKKDREKEIVSWENSIPKLIQVICNAGLHDLYIVFEYQTPIGQERIDAILIGYRRGTNNIIASIIELKQWCDIDISYKKDETKVKLSPEDKPRSHPIAQTHTYKKHMKMNHQHVVSGEIEILEFHYLHNFKTKNKAKLFSDQYKIYDIRKDTLFTEDEEDRFKQCLSKVYDIRGIGEAYRLLTEGEYTFGEVGFQNLQQMLEGKEFTTLLEEQRTVACEVVQQIEKFDLGSKNERLLVIISGDTGTGKSILGMELMRRFIKKGSKKCVFTTPSKTLKEIMKGFSKTNIGNTYWVLENKKLDFIVIDEAHRLDNIEQQMERALTNNKIVVLLQDDKQRIKFSEQGTLRNIIDSVDKIKVKTGLAITYTTHKLETQMRAAYKSNYIKLVTDFLEGSLQDTRGVDSSYEVNVFDSLQHMNNVMKELNETNRCKWIASYCWDWSGNLNKSDIIINQEEYVFSKTWNPKDNQFEWYIGKEEADLNQVACVYTSQGLDYAYTGILFWDDLYYENGQWKVDLNKIKDRGFIKEIVNYYGGQLSNKLKDGKWQVNYSGVVYEIDDFLKQANADREEILKLVKNIYRIILSRASKGINIWFKHEDTKRLFCNIIKTKMNIK